MTPQQITQRAIEIAVGNGWDLEEFYRNNISQLITCFKENIIEGVVQAICDFRLEKLLFFNIPFAKALWMRGCGDCSACDYDWQYHLQHPYRQSLYQKQHTVRQDADYLDA